MCSVPERCKSTDDLHMCTSNIKLKIIVMCSLYMCSQTHLYHNVLICNIDITIRSFNCSVWVEIRILIFMFMYWNKVEFLKVVLLSSTCYAQWTTVIHGVAFQSCHWVGICALNVMSSHCPEIIDPVNFIWSINCHNCPRVGGSCARRAAYIASQTRMYCMTFY